jgi:hypothetical protein
MNGFGWENGRTISVELDNYTNGNYTDVFLVDFVYNKIRKCYLSSNKNIWVSEDFMGNSEETYEAKRFEDRIEYYKDGKVHRDDDLPAIEWNDGDKYWYQKGQLHRLNGPSVESMNGAKIWHQNGLLHRLNGPAYEELNGYKEWYINDEQYSEEEYNEIVSGKNVIDEKYEIKKLDDRIEYRYKGKLHRDNDLPAIEWNDGGKEWHQNGKYHRDNGPAIERVNGRKYWYQNSKLHRVSGPAIEYEDGSKEWFQNGKQHRLSGPAVEYPGVYKEWWIEGIQYSEEKYNKILSSKI